MSFQKDFLWCVGGAAAQQDGGYLDGGKGLNIWDALSEGRVKNGDTCHIACDHFHKWKEDLQLLKVLGVNSYRFSVSLARIYPKDEFTVNEEGVKFYIDLVAELRRLGIEPICTLYHWDMPLWLHERGGWKSSLAVEWFERFTKTIVNAISDKVQYWLTFNEPQIFVGHGYQIGKHAPFEKLSQKELQNISRNVMLAHGRAVRVIRKYAKLSPKIGFASTCDVLLPLDSDDEEKAYLASFDSTRNGVYNPAWWCDPMLAGKAPNGCDWLSEEDLKEIYESLDFTAYNIYNARHIEESKYSYAGMPLTDMGWSITPECMYYSAKFMHRRYGLPITITENGMANIDFVYEDGKVHDPQRSEYLRTHIKNLKRANDEGVPVIGYSCWSFMDNFEWSEGYSKRFGLVYVDYRTQKRIVKDSAYTFRDIIKANGENL